MRLVVWSSVVRPATWRAVAVASWWDCCALPARERNPGAETLFKPLRQVIESVNNTLKTQLDLERHGGRTFAGVAARVLQRILALTAAIWHNEESTSRSCDH